MKQKLRRKPKKYYSHEYIKKLGDSIDLRPPRANERMTRFQHIIRLPGKKSEYAVAALQNLKLHYGDNFCKIFKSITADNGSEFADLSKIPTRIFFAHPYWERGTNERQNGLVRFFIPKGKLISSVSDKTIKLTENWINNIPRKIFGYKSSQELFNEQISIITNR